tara:strand:+ start:16952 stop:18079 length:1128 start_codon:yes stop_codon:yes gene_type:complete
MTKVLIFIDWYYPASKAGGPISSVLNMVNLLHKNFDFFIVTGSKDLNSQNNLQDVILNNWQSVGFAKVIYLDNKYQKIKKLKEVVNKIKPDIIYVNGIFSRFFSVLPIYLFDNYYSIIVNPRGMFGEGALEIKKIKKLFFIFFTRIFSFYKNVIWHVSNINEYNQLVTNLNSKIRFYISPNIPRQIHFYKKQKNEQNLKLISVGRVCKIKNFEFLIKLLSKVDFQCELSIIGPIEESNYFNFLQKSIQKLPKNIKVRFTGLLEKNQLDQEIINSDLLISTSLNENYGHSIVEALAYGRPVLISEFCPWDGLSDLNAGYRLPLDINLFLAKLILFAKMDNKTYSSYNYGARNYYEKFILTENLKNTYIDLLNNTIK